MTFVVTRNGSVLSQDKNLRPVTMGKKKLQIHVMIEVKAYINREKNGTYSIFVDEDAPINYGLIGEGKTVEEAIKEWNAMYAAMKASYARDNMPFTEVVFKFTYDIPSFLSFYSNIISLKGLSKLTGISAAQLSQYATGYRNPSPKTTAKIQNGLHTIAQELSQVAFI